MSYPKWRQDARKRIHALLEYCRECGVVSDRLTFDHILPKSLGGQLTMDNATILCVTCQHLKGNQIWPHQRSLWDERLDLDGALRVVDPLLRERALELLSAVPKKRKRKRAVRFGDRNLAPVPCPWDCICSSCEFWRQKRVVG